MNQEVTGKSAILGLGIIGSRVAGRVAAAGCELATWSRTPRGRLDELGCVKDAVTGAERVSLFLKDGHAVRAVMGEGADVLRSGQVIMNHSTVDLETTRWLAAFCEEIGCGFLDAPFTGSKVAAEKGELVYYVSGREQLAAQQDGYLALSSRLRMACGPVGNATVIKLATNLISACSVQAMAEALAICVRHGVNADDLIRAVGVNAHASPLAMMKMPVMAAGDYQTHFSLGNMEKDGRYACRLADEAGIEVPAIGAVARRMKELCADGLADLDYSALAKPYLDS